MVAVTTLLIAFFAFSIVRTTKVEGLKLPEERPSYRRLKEPERRRPSVRHSLPEAYTGRWEGGERTA